MASINVKAMSRAILRISETQIEALSVSLASFVIQKAFRYCWSIFISNFNLPSGNIYFFLYMMINCEYEPLWEDYLECFNVLLLLKLQILSEIHNLFPLFFVDNKGLTCCHYHQITTTVPYFSSSWASVLVTVAV